MHINFDLILLYLHLQVRHRFVLLHVLVESFSRSFLNWRARGVYGRLKRAALLDFVFFLVLPLLSLKIMHPFLVGAVLVELIVHLGRLSLLFLSL